MALKNILPIFALILSAAACGGHGKPHVHGRAVAARDEKPHFHDRVIAPRNEKSHIHTARDASRPTPEAHDVLHKGLKALGGKKALDRIAGVTYEAPKEYRSLSLMQSYNMLMADVYISINGGQNISFAYSSGNLQQRIDRSFTRSEYWYFATPTLSPIDFSLVVQDGHESFASYVRGNNNLFEDPTEAGGYQDNGLVEFLAREANVMSPKLLSVIADNNDYTTSQIELHPGVKLPAVHDSKSNLTVIFNDTSHLPYIIRTYEDNYVYGPSTRDLQLDQYKRVKGVMYPQRFLTIYNTKSVLEEVSVTAVKVNPKFPTGFFSGRPETEPVINKKTPPPVDLQEYSQSEIGEAYENMLWNGAYTGTFGAIEAVHPAPELPNLWHLKFPDAGDYENLVLEFDDGVMVLDTPAHQSKLIIKWVRKNLKKPITRVWPSHHHHDHSGGMSDFTALNATLIVPAIAAEYWSIAAPAATVVTYDAAHPFVHHDGAMQIRLLWEPAAVHAADWSYAVVTTACPGPHDPIVAFEADAWTPADMSDVSFARQWLRQAENDGLSRDAIVVAAHGSNTQWPLQALIDHAGYAYPDFDTRSWKTGGPICLT